MSITFTRANGCVIVGALLLFATAVGANPGDRTAMSMTAGFPAAGAGPLRLLFIHHSCGGQLLADPGTQVGGGRNDAAQCIYVSHPNGGGLRRLLEAAGYEVHEATYGSKIGEHTDICDWRRKFATQMPEVLTCDRQDDFYGDGRTNQIVVFKSCYSSIDFVGPGDPPGDPDGCEQTVANAKAAYRALLPLFRARPEVLFVAVTAPPRAEPRPSGVGGKLKAAFKSGPTSADRAREVDDWLVDREQGWLAGYPLPNVAVFDYYDLLTGGQGQLVGLSVRRRRRQPSQPRRQHAGRPGLRALPRRRRGRHAGRRPMSRP